MVKSVKWITCLYIFFKLLPHKLECCHCLGANEYSVIDFVVSKPYGIQLYFVESWNVGEGL